MGKEFSRTHRLADQIQKEIANLIQFQIKDPRLGMVTVNAVKVSKDMGYADVYFTRLKINDDLQKDGEGSDDIKDAEAILNSAAGYLRTELSHLIRLRAVPQLRFHYDVSVSRGQELSALIDRARQSDNINQQNEDQDSD